MRYLAVLLSALWLIAPGMPSAEGAAPAAGMGLVYAITEVTAEPRTTTIYLHAADSGERRTLYRDASDENRILARIASSDVLGAARAVPPMDVYLIMGEASMGDLSMGADALCRLRIPEAGEEQAAPEPILVIPLCFSDASPYGLWNRAPVFAVSPKAERVALCALRAGDVRFARPAIRVLGSDGTEGWRILLDDRDLYVADLAWSPDGRWLAYAVMPQGDEHTLDDAQLPKAGLYLADLEARTTRLIHRCYADAVAWGPGPDRVTVAARANDFWSQRYVAQVLAVPSGEKVEEFSLPSRVSSATYSSDGKWLAVQAASGDSQQIWLYPSTEGWGQLFHEVRTESGRLSLLGWAGVPGAGTEP
jgi:Tol biopolymer transport system component